MGKCDEFRLFATAAQHAATYADLGGRVDELEINLAFAVIPSANGTFCPNAIDWHCGTVWCCGIVILMAASLT